MKKLLMVLAIAGFAVACNNDSDKEAKPADTTVTAPTVDTTHMAAPDTTHKDTTKM